MKTHNLTPMHFESLVSAMSCGVVVLNALGKIDWANPKAQTWFACQSGQLWREVVENAFVSSSELEDELTLKSGEKIKFETNALPSQEGQMILCYDVTYSRAVQDKLNQAKRLQLLGNMCANLAHQIRNPLFSGLIKVNTLLKSYPQEQKLEALRGNLKAIEQEINAVLLFSKSDNTVVDRVVLTEILEEAIEVSNIENKEIVIDYETQLFDEDTILGNAQALTGVFSNLIANAIEASEPKSQIMIRVLEKAHHFEILIRDFGEGIGQLNPKQLFEPFYTTKAKGTGLGLSVALQVIKNHHGEITLSGHPQQGTEVRVTLPKG